MILSEAEREDKIKGFLDRKFKQFGIEGEEPSSRTLRSMGGREMEG